MRQSSEIVKFRLHDGYLMIVQTMVNNAGPFNFLLDTGTTRTVLDHGLARQWQAPIIGEVALTGVLRSRQDKLVKNHDVRLDQVFVSGFGAIVDELPRQKLLELGILGVLGEDFLSNFDFLIDYKARILRFGEEAPASESARQRYADWMWFSPAAQLHSTQ